MNKVLCCILLMLFFLPSFVHAQASGGQIKRDVSKKKTSTPAVKQKVTKYSYSTPQVVDLGLPSGTLWADCNLGANFPEEKGYVFPWGETIPCERSNRYKDNGMPKETIQNTQKLELKDDAAYVNLGSSWCMPTHEQFKELTNCDHTEIIWANQNGTCGLRIRSKYNGNTIFIPTSGKSYAPYYGYYWTSDIDRQDNRQAYSLVFNEDGVRDITNGMRYQGRSIRPVYNP